MARIDSMTLIADEKIIKKLKPHWVVLIPVILVFVIFTTVYGVLMAWTLNETYGIWKDILGWTLTIIWFFSTLLLTIKRLVWWATTKYLFTNKRVVTRTGLIKVQGESIALNKVQSIQFEKTLLERLVGSGSLVIESASENEIRIIFVTQAEQIQQQIYAQISSNETTDGVDNSI